MAGIYVHIPFCLRACNYCDFHFTTYLKYAEHIADAIILEAQYRKEYLEGAIVETIYFGGGTPSVVDAALISRILRTLIKVFRVGANAEITIELNPDDATDEKAGAYLEMGINRVSIGIQSFRDEDLILLNRRHTAIHALQSVELLMKKGFRNISIDLIYGLPESRLKFWRENLRTALGLGINHLSAYHLSYEPGTVLYYAKMKRNLQALSDEESERQYRCLVRETGKRGMEQYEISNFARDKAYSKHNTAYWNGSKYLGLGPSAHSYNGSEREWNKKGIMSYIRHMKQGKPYREKERLNPEMKFNEYLMTSLRTKWGIDLQKIGRDHGVSFVDHLMNKARSHFDTGNLLQKGDALILTRKAKFIADTVVRDLFLD